MNPYYESDGIAIYNGDAEDLIPALGKFDLVLTDPPYSSGGAFRSDRARPTSQKYQISAETSRVYTDFSGDNRDQRTFEKWCAGWMRHAIEATNPGGAIGCFIDWRNIASVIDALQIAGWVYRGCVPWHKGSDQRPRKGWFRANVEYVIWGSAGAMLTGHRAEGMCADGVVYCRMNGRDKVHQTQKPVGTMEALMAVRPGWLSVLDPFAGAGTTLVAAKRMGKRAVGIEKSEAFCEAAAKRLESAEAVPEAIGEAN